MRRALRKVLTNRQGHCLMVADVDGGPCLFCAACGAWCTTKPQNLRLPCGGRGTREAAGMAALRRFREGYVPDCGDSRGRRVHAVEQLCAGAAQHWNNVPLPKRSDAIARHFAESDIARANSLPPLGTRSTREEKVRYLLQACRVPPLPSNA